MKGLDYRDYATRIKEQLMLEDAEKYRYVSVKAIRSHIKHIGWCLTQIVETHNDHFESPYFSLKRGYRKYFNGKYRAALYRKQLEKESQLALEQENAEKALSESLGLKKELSYWADIFMRSSYR